MPCYDPGAESYHEACKQNAVLPACLDEVKRGEPFNLTERGSFKGRNWTQDRRDAAAAELCALCKSIDVTKYSLELQIWWRDHQKWDKERLEKERVSAAKTVLVVVIKDGLHVVRAALNDLLQEPWAKEQGWTVGFTADSFVRELKLDGVMGQDAILVGGTTSEIGLLTNLWAWTEKCREKHHRDVYVLLVHRT